MKYLKTYEQQKRYPYDDLVFPITPDKTLPKDFRFAPDNLVVFKDISSHDDRVYRIVFVNRGFKNNDFGGQYALEDITNTKNTKWAFDEELEFAPEHFSPALKYNL